MQVILDELDRGKCDISIPGVVRESEQCTVARTMTIYSLYIYDR